MAAAVKPVEGAHPKSCGCAVCYAPPPVAPSGADARRATKADPRLRNPNIFSRADGPPPPAALPVAKEQRTQNPNFIRADDPIGRSANLGALSHKNFVGRTERDDAASQTERVSGVAVRRAGESVAKFEGRQRELARRKQRAIGGAPAVLSAELERAERRWKTRIPTEVELKKYAEHFQHMNDLRVALGRPRVDYSQLRADDSGEYAAARLRFGDFVNKDTEKRLSFVETSKDTPLLRIAAIHDVNEGVRELADKRLGVLGAHDLIG